MNKFAFPLLAIFAAVGLYFMFIRPTLDEIAILQEQKARFETQVMEAREVEQRLTDLEESFLSISEEDLAKIEYILPKELDIPRITASLKNIVDENNGDLIDIALGDSVLSKEDEGYIEQKIQLGLNLPYTSFINLLREIETSLQFSNITEIEIGRKESSGSDTVVAPYRVTLTFYQAI